MKNTNLRKFCVAPMMGYTTPHARKLYRILSKKAFLFTEMIPSNTMLYSKKNKLLIRNDSENPVALQVGGSKFQDLAKCAKIFAEISLVFAWGSRSTSSACARSQSTGRGRESLGIGPQGRHSVPWHSQLTQHPRYTIVID